jgi:hypothetical protein
VRDGDRIMVDVDHLRAGIDRLGHLVHIADGRNAGSEIEELVDPGLAQVDHDTSQELPCIAQNRRQPRHRPQNVLTELTIRLEVVRPAQVEVIDPRHTRTRRIDLDRSPTRSINRHATPKITDLRLQAA